MSVYSELAPVREVVEQTRQAELNRMVQYAHCLQSYVQEYAHESSNDYWIHKNGISQGSKIC